MANALIEYESLDGDRLKSLVVRVQQQTNTQPINN
jgi:hypothetical protein